MKRALLLIASTAFISVLFSMRSANEWTPLLDNRLSKWENYLSYAHQPGYNGKIPKDKEGNPIAPIGYNKDAGNVFSVSDDSGNSVLRVSGETYGCLISRRSYKNYHLKLQVKWGDQKCDPRKDKLRDSGILYHSTGEAGAEYWRTWMLSQEFQIMEGHMGDFWCQANSAIDIRSFQSEGVMSCVADPRQPFRTYKSGADYYCMRSANHESAPGQWTSLELICYEGKSLHIVNGNVVMVLRNSRYIAPDGQEVPMTNGKIQLQSEAAEVFYKDIFIKELTALPQDYAGCF